MNHLRLLKQGRDQWNKWRKKNKTKQIELSDVTLVEITRTKPPEPANLSGYDLEEAIFTGASLYCVIMRGRRTRLREALLQEANLNQADMRSADLVCADFTSAEARGIRLEHASMVEAVLNLAMMNGAKMFRTDMRGIKAQGVWLEKAKAERADIQGGNFDNGHLAGINLRKAKIGDTSFRGSDLTGADLRDAEITGPIDLHGANIWGVRGLPKELRDQYLRSVKSSWGRSPRPKVIPLKSPLIYRLPENVANAAW